MNAVVIVYIEVLLAVVLVAVFSTLILGRELVARARESVAWMLKVSFVDFVKMVIFLKPWKPYAWQTSVILWLILTYVAGRYMIGTQPKLAEIPGPYIPMIGYIYYLTVLYVVAFVMFATAKLAHKD
jgi:hypothetical protein